MKSGNKFDIIEKIYLGTGLERKSSSQHPGIFFLFGLKNRQEEPLRYGSAWSKIPEISFPLFGMIGGCILSTIPLWVIKRPLKLKLKILFMIWTTVSVAILIKMIHFGLVNRFPLDVVDRVFIFSCWVTATAVALYQKQ